MDTLFILRDTITARVVQVIDSYQTCFQEAEPNNNDFWIALIICSAIVATAMIVGCTIILCKKAALSSKINMERVKNENEEKQRTYEIERQKTERELKKEKQIPYKEESFIDFCQNDVHIKEKLTDICAHYYKEVMAKRLNIEEKENSKDSP